MTGTTAEISCLEIKITLKILRSMYCKNKVYDPSSLKGHIILFQIIIVIKNYATVVFQSY